MILLKAKRIVEHLPDANCHE